MSFLEVRVNDLIESISYDTVGGPTFSTTVVTTAAGREKRNINWSQSRGRWELGERQMMHDELERIVDFFQQAAGKAFGFRFKDWGDYRCTSAQGFLVPSSIPGYFQLTKRYGAGAFSRAKTITKPVEDSVTIYSDGVAVSAVIDHEKGLVSTASTGVLTWAGEFDLPARFDADQIQHRFDVMDGGNMMFFLMSLPVVELKPFEVTA